MLMPEYKNQACNGGATHNPNLSTSIQISDFLRLFKFLINLLLLSLIRVIGCNLIGGHRQAAQVLEQTHCNLNAGSKRCTASTSDKGGDRRPIDKFLST